MKIKTILKWIIGLMVINSPFTMESSNINTGNSYHQSFKIPSIGSLMKKGLIGLNLINSGFSNSINDNKNISLQAVTKTCPPFIEALTPFGVDGYKIINDIFYKVSCSNQMVFYSQTTSDDTQFFEDIFSYYGYQHLQKNTNFINQPMDDQSYYLYSGIVMFDSLNTHVNFTNPIADSSDNDLIRYVMTTTYKSQDGTDTESFQYHYAPNYFGKHLTTVGKPDLTSNELSSQRKEIIANYKWYNHAITKYEFYYRNSYTWTCNLNLNNKKYTCQNTNGDSEDFTDNNKDLFQHPLNQLPRPCPFVLDKNAINYNRNCIFDLNQYNNYSVASCRSSLKDYIMLAPGTHSIDGLKYKVNCFQSDFKTFIQYSVLDASNNILNTVESSIESSKLLSNRFQQIAPTNIKNSMFYDSVIIFDSINNGVTTSHANDIIGYSIGLYYENSDIKVLVKTVQHHLNAYVSGLKSDKTTALTADELKTERLNIIKKYSTINHTVYKYNFIYRNGNKVDYVLSKTCTKDANNVITACNYFYDEYIFNEIEGAVDLSIFNTLNKHILKAGTSFGPGYVATPLGTYQTSYPPILGSNGIDYNAGGVYKLLNTPSSFIDQLKNDIMNLPQNLLSFVISSLLNLPKNLLLLIINVTNMIMDAMLDENRFVKSLVTIGYIMIYYSLDRTIKNNFNNHITFWTDLTKIIS